MDDDKKKVIITALEGFLFEDTGLMSEWSDIGKLIDAHADDEHHNWRMWSALESLVGRIKRLEDIESGIKQMNDCVIYFSWREEKTECPLCGHTGLGEIGFYTEEIQGVPSYVYHMECGQCGDDNLFYVPVHAKPSTGSPGTVDDIPF